MDKTTLISIDILCEQHQIDNQLLVSLQEFGLIAIVFENEKAYVAEHELAILEKIICFHNDLQINKEGIEVIFRLLEEVKARQDEITILKNKLRLYEQDDY